MFDKVFKQNKTLKNCYKGKYEARFTDYRQIITRKLEEYNDRNLARIPVSKQLALVDKTGLLESSDYITLYPSSIAHLDSKWPKIEIAEAINIEDSDRLGSLFIIGDWKGLNKSGFFKVR